MTLGSTSELTPAQARELAQDKMAEVRKGFDPADQKAADRNAKTMVDLCDDYLTWLKKRTQKPVKPSTIAQERGRIEAHVKPLLGKRAVRTLDLDAVEQFFQDIADGKTATPRPPKGETRKRGGIIRGGIAAAHRNTEMLGAILQYAIGKKAHPGPNPVFLFTREKKRKLKPPFDIEAVKRVGAALREMEAEGEDKVPLRAIRHLILSGFRRMEALTLAWGKVDPRAHCARLADTKTGPQIRALGQAALDHLFSFGPYNNPGSVFVFPGDGKTGHFVGLPKVWERVAKRAEVEGVTLHGLRHWFSSAGAELGFSDIIIGAIIGHAKKGVTGHYATAPDSALIMAADRIARYLGDALEGRTGSKVIPFNVGRADTL